MTWLLRGIKDVNLNISFIKWLDPIGLFGCCFENCFGKQFFRTVFKNNILCFFSKKLCLRTEFWKIVFVLKNKKNMFDFF